MLFYTNMEMPDKNAKHRDAQVLMFHLQLHASCTKTLAEPAVESHFLGHQVSLL